MFIKSELKVGVIYVKEGQYTEEEILDNNDNSALFEEFLQILGTTKTTLFQQTYLREQEVRLRM